MTARNDELTKIWRDQSNPEFKGMCAIVRVLVDDDDVKADSPLVNAVLKKNWATVSSFFRAVDAGHDLNRFVGTTSPSFAPYVRTLVVRYLPKETDHGFNFDEDTSIRPRRKQKIPAKMVMPVVVGVLALLCLLFVGVNMVGTGQRSEKKAEQSSLETQLQKALAEKAALEDVILGQNARLDDFNKRLTNVQGSQGHVEAERLRVLNEAILKFDRKADACVQTVSEEVETKIVSAKVNHAQLVEMYAINKVAIETLTAVLDGLKNKSESIQADTKNLQAGIGPLKTQLDQIDSRSKDMRVKVDMISDDLNNNFYVYVSLLALVVCFCGAIAWFVRSSVVYMDHSISSFHKKYNDHLELLTGSHDRFQTIENRLEAVEDILAAQGRAPRAAQGSSEDNQDAAPVPAGPGRVRARKGAK
jgi:predicted  nucleic acid-binding Zn-ribbon protein